jgi:hypothetical protein
VKKMQELLASWQTQPVTQLGLAEVRTDTSLQPRSDACISLAHVRSEMKRSEDHARVIAARLLTPAVELEPILVGRTEGSLFVVDGHHRWQASRLAGRSHVPAKVMEIDWTDAVMVSKVVNFGAEKMGMHHGQRQDACWQLLAQQTQRGTQRLPKGITQEAIAQQCAISTGNVSSMMKRLKERTIDPESTGGSTLMPARAGPDGYTRGTPGTARNERRRR